ncbi:E-selectin-like, partial [Anneissia japonica]|uniref:E-selectin-like n=1 Tax=Anneissia japonica TaxID=1529436 RepID=UPI001425940C
PCNVIPQPTNGYIHGGNWRTDTVATCGCEENYSINGSVTRRCLANGEWTGYECSCMINRCETIQPLENGMIIKMSEYTIGGTLEFSCNEDYRLIGESVVECQENGNWNGSVPICEDICEYNECTVNQKCVVVEEQPTCVCKTTSDCPPDDQPVCGSDARTYGNACLVQVVACDSQSDIYIAHAGKCQYGMDIEPI